MSDLLPCKLCGMLPTLHHNGLTVRCQTPSCTLRDLVMGEPEWQTLMAATRPAAPVEANREALLVEALNELRSCSQAKIGMEEDFACADKQMRDALAAYQAGTGAVDAKEGL